MPRNAKNPAASTAAKQEKRKMRRGILLLVLFFFLLAGGIVLLFWLKHQFFDRNPRFTLTNVELYNNGFWGKTDENRTELYRFIGLRINEQNLFELSPADLRSKLKSIANIADAEVEIVLPDTVVIRIEERIPRAFIGYHNANFVIDADGMVMNSHQCFGVHQKLPSIVGIRGSVDPGVALPAAASALELIMQITRSFPQFQIDFVSVQPTDELLFKLKAYGRHYMVTIPRKNIPDMLDVLKSTLDDCRARHDERTRINLSFEGRVVLGN